MKWQTEAERTNLCKALRIFAEKHPAQKITADRILTFIQEHEDCFERSCLEGHITGSAWLLNPAGDKVLLTLHHKLQRWMQTGGHADGEKNILNVALKEAEEESGIPGIIPEQAEIYDIDIHRIPARPAKGEPEHNHYDIRYLLRAPHEVYSISQESDALAWWSAEDFIKRGQELDEAVLRMARRYFNYHS